MVLSQLSVTKWTVRSEGEQATDRRETGMAFDRSLTLNEISSMDQTLLEKF